MKNKLKKTAWILGISLAVLFLFVCLTVVGSKNPFENYKTKLRAAGEKLTIAELIPPRIPAEQNSAGLLRQAASLASASESLFSSNPPAAMRMIAPGKAMIGWRGGKFKASGCWPG